MSFQFTLEKPMPPVWMMYPDILQFSLGWRMGYGESYSHDLGDWLKTLPKKDQKEYDKMFPRPSFWHEDFEENYYDLIPFWQPGGATKYSLGKLENSTAEPFIFFWKPSPGIIDKSCLSQWQPCEFRADATHYASTEQYMMAEKARLFGDEEAEEKIMRSSDSKEIKSLGKSVRKFNQTIWDKVKYSIVLNGNYYKFSQLAEMRNYLFSTGNSVLVEASPLDTIWGIGLGENNPKAHNPATWRGKNLLGFALMEVRDELRKLYSNYDKVPWEQLTKYTA